MIAWPMFKTELMFIDTQWKIFFSIFILKKYVICLGYLAHSKFPRWSLWINFLWSRWKSILFRILIPRNTAMQWKSLPHGFEGCFHETGISFSYEAVKFTLYWINTIIFKVINSAFFYFNVIVCLTKKPVLRRWNFDFCRIIIFLGATLFQWHFGFPLFSHPFPSNLGDIVAF